MKEIFVTHGDGSIQGMQVPDDWEGDPQQFAVSPSVIEQLHADRDQYQAQKYLKETDWYVTRKLDTGEAIPAEVEAKRQEARGIISGFRANYPVQDTPAGPIAVPPATQMRIDGASRPAEDSAPPELPPEVPVDVVSQG